MIARAGALFRLAGAGLRHYHREHALLGAATATAVAVLVGALVVGDSVRGSLRAAFTARLGAADDAVLASSPFSAHPERGLAARLAGEPRFARVFVDSAPVLRLSGVAYGPGGAPVPVTVFGVDRRFFEFHETVGAGEVGGEIGRGAARLSRGLREEWGAGAPGPGEALILRVESDPAIAAASLFGEKEEFAVSRRRTVEEWPPVPAGSAGASGAGPSVGDFEIFPRGGAVRAVFLRLDDLSRAVEGGGGGGGGLRANTLLLRRRATGESSSPEGAPAEAFRAALGAVATLEDFGLTLRPGSGAGSDAGNLVLESRGLVLPEAAVAAAATAAGERGLFADPVLTWLAGTLRAGERETPYSLVSGLPERLFPVGADRLIPGTWLREDLDLRPGDPVEVEFLSWEAEGRFGTVRETFRAAPARERTGLAADPTLSPEYPGVTDSARIGDWDPPFPVDLARIRRKDEDYWEEWRTLPKAFLPLAAARRLASAGGGGATSVRFAPMAGAGPGLDGTADETRDELATALVGALDPAAFGLAPLPVREQGIEASRGATDFGLYFLYFSFFLLASTLVLIVLLFRLGIERRLREIGLLLATGWPRRRVSSLLLTEVGLVAFLGAAVGALLGVAYAGGMIRLLTGVWGGALGGALEAADAGGGGAAAPLELFVRWQSVGSGALGGLEMACLSAWWTLRRLLSRTPRTLLSGDLGAEREPGPVASIQAPEEDAGPVAGPAIALPRRPRPLAGPAAALTVGLGAGALLALTAAGVVPETPGFFGAGGLLLTAALLFVRSRLRSAGAGALSGMRGLALRASSFRPGRSLAALAMIAFAAFLLVAVESFRKRSPPGEIPAGAGGFLAVTETVFGVPWDPNSPEGREALGLPDDSPDDPGGLRVRPLRLAGDEDASCLNLYRPDRPRILGVPRDLAEENRFPFAAHLGETPEENANPWRLLWRERAPGEPIPVLGDQNSMTYVLKWPVGETRAYPVGEGGAPVELRLVGTLWDSVFQGELLMAERDLLDRLPVADGYRVFLVDRDPPPRGPAALAEAEAAAAALLADPLREHGGVSRTARARLAEFHRVENTYLSTFQALGGLGLLLGTLGLVLVLFRNAAERRREWALLAAVGYRRRDFAALGFWENAFVLAAGLGAGALSALLAVFPVLGAREAGGSFGLLALLLAGVLALGLLAGAAAARLAANRPPTPALRAE